MPVVPVLKINQKRYCIESGARLNHIICLFTAYAYTI